MTGTILNLLRTSLHQTVSKNVIVTAVLHLIDVQPFLSHCALDEVVQRRKASGSSMQDSRMLLLVLLPRHYNETGYVCHRTLLRTCSFTGSQCSSLNENAGHLPNLFICLVKDTQQHTQHAMPLLVDCAIHCSAAKLLYSRHMVTYNMHRWPSDVPLNFGVWHVYKSVVNMTCRQFLPLFTHMLHPRGGARIEMRSHPCLFDT